MGIWHLFVMFTDRDVSKNLKTKHQRLFADEFNEEIS